MAKRWKNAEISELEKVAATQTVEELAERFDVDVTVMKKKLDALGLDARVGRANDPLLAVYEKGIKALHAKKWSQAEGHLEKVAAGTDQQDLAERARRLLAVCQERMGADEAEGDKDPFLMAVYQRNRGNLEGALEMCAAGGRQSKDERFAFLAASILTLQGDLDKAAGMLENAISQNPSNRIHAYFDSDFDDLRNSPDHTHLFD